jgi:serine/threonine-protein kinase
VKHGRYVAVKVLLPELAAALGGERFLQEIRVTAKLTHPHILTLIDSGEADGLLFYVMPFVEGESLRDRLKREKQLPVEDALRIATQVASALDFAHRHDVIHRDIKPENILLHEGEAMVADFGIALAVTAAGGERLTETGLSIGTPEYMSPEQVAGERTIDARSDIYSLACVLYEMLAGQPPFTGATAQAVLARHVTDAVPPITTVRSGLSAPTARAVTKALGKAPADRFVSATAFSEALVATRADAGEEKKSIAVLPFVNLSPDPENEYFSDGMTEEIINALVHLEDLHVASRSSSFAFKGLSPDIAEVGAKLKVATVLEGSVRASGDRLRITAQLIKVADGYHLWSERYDRRMEDVFDIQDEIAQAIVEALKVELLGVKTARLLKRGTQDLEAYQLYLQGRHLWSQRGEGMSRCIPYFEQAIEQDPEYAEPHAGLADAVSILAFYGFLPPLDAYAKARAAAERAVALDDELAEAHYSIGLCQWYFGWDGDLAATEFKRAIELNPRMAVAHAWLGQLYETLGRHAESAVEAQRARELEPVSPLINVMVAFAHMFGSGRLAQAREAAARALAIDPTFGPAHWVMGLVAMADRNYEEAVRYLLNGASSMRGSPMILGFLGGAYARLGREAEARKILAELEERSEQGLSLYNPMALIHYDLGELDLAFTQLERAFEQRTPAMWYVTRLDGVSWPRSDPRLVKLLDRPELKWLERVTDQR